MNSHSGNLNSDSGKSKKVFCLKPESVFRLIQNGCSEVGPEYAHVGEYSRGGRSRGIVAVKALDHDMCPKEKLVPSDILEPVTGGSFLFFGTHYKTSNFIDDSIILWWKEGMNFAA